MVNTKRWKDGGENGSVVAEGEPDNVPGASLVEQVRETYKVRKQVC